MYEPLHQLAPSDLRSLASSLRDGPLSQGLSSRALAMIAGPRAEEVRSCLEALLSTGMSTGHVASLVDAIAEAWAQARQQETAAELVLSGPELDGVPTCHTATTMRRLMQEATSEILMVGYVVHQARELLQGLAERMRDHPELKVRFCLDLPRKLGDTTLDSELVWLFAREFAEKHWPWEPRPAVYYDPRSLSQDMCKRSSLHAKCIVADRKVALVTSANFTEAAQVRNIEVGVVLRQASMARRLAEYFEGLIARGLLLRCPS